MLRDSALRPRKIKKKERNRRFSNCDANAIYRLHLAEPKSYGCVCLFFCPKFEAEGTTAGTVPTTTALLLKRYPRQANPADASGQNTTGRPPLKKTNLVNMVTLYKVNWEAFDSCDISSGQRVGQVKSQDASLLGSITLPPSLLAIEDNYFLGKQRRNGRQSIALEPLLALSSVD